MQWRNREKQNDQEHHVKSSFFHLTDRTFHPHFLLLVMLFAHAVKRSNSRSHLFFKTGVFEKFAILTGKHVCWTRFLIRFQD